MRPRKEIDKGFVVNRLLAGEPATSIASRLSMSPPTFRKRCLELGIDINPRRIAYRRLDALDTARIYVEWRVSVKVLSEESGINPKMIRAYLRDRGVHVRSRGEQYRIDTAAEHAYVAWLNTVWNVKEYF